MFEIKRLNRLWSNDALHCKTHVSIPLFNESRSAVVTPTQLIDTLRETAKTPDQKSITPSRTLDTLNEQAGDESINDIFKRIDSNVKQTKKAVKTLNKRARDL